MNAKMLRTSLILGLSLAPATAFARHPHSHGTYGFGTVSVRNDTPVTLTVTVNGAARVLPPQMTAALTVPAGQTRISATYVEYGRTQSLAVNDLYLEPGRFRWIELDTPIMALVSVTNEYDRIGNVFANGRFVASIAPFATQLVSMPAGAQDLSMVVDGRTVERERVYARAMIETRFVADAPRFADVHIQNPLPIPVVLTTDRGLSQTVPAYGMACLDDVAVGSVRLTARRMTGEVIDQATLSVGAFADNRWVVDPPRTGLVSVDNDTRELVTVYESGRALTNLVAGQESRIALPIGWHELSIRDCHGRELEARWVEVEAYDLARLDVDEPRHERAYARDDRGDRDDRDDRDGHRRDDRCADGHC